MHKSRTLSTSNSVPEFTAQSPLKTPDEDTETSPIKWGFLAAAVCHLGNVFASGLTSTAPWAGVHGMYNILIVFSLAYVVFFWNRRFNTSLYVRKELIRYSGAIMVSSLGFLLGHVIVLGAYARGTEQESCRDSFFGCLTEVFAFTPIFYAILCGLWALFIYIQRVAAENLKKTLPSPPPETVSITEELNKSIGSDARLASPPTTTGKSFMQSFMAYYIVTSVASVALIGISFGLFENNLGLALTAFLAAALSLASTVSISMRTSLYTLSAHGLLILGSFLFFGLSFLWNNMTVGARIVCLVLTVVFQIVALGMACLRFDQKRDEDAKARRRASVHFFRTNKKQEVANPMTYFMAGVHAADNDVVVV